MDVLGHFIRSTPMFRGKGRLINYWFRHRDQSSERVRMLPGGEPIICDLAIPYEAVVWLKREEQSDLNTVRQLLKPGQTFVDCGANIGIWTLVAAASLQDTGEVYAFEPNPSTYEKLERNINTSKLRHRIRPYQSAVGSEPKTVLFRCENAHNISQIVVVGESNAIQIEVTALDTLLIDTPVHGIKIDVEGYELEALKGTKLILEKYKPWLCIEFNTSLTGVNVLQDWDVHQYLRDFGYVCRRFQDSLDHSSRTILPDSWKTTGYCNLFYSLR